ncbi:hypothetical protein K2173_017264 [Erythroxylum novogranatense]|uniref:Uncharacterized protein n=1 Tax=Erythroxylum novogranatense TaxID=1862640 RepID=A0AAV8U925_9ROSI|nr:hypothetical protein K2173_017264 [Erythroxylum novogranatense]
MRNKSGLSFFLVRQKRQRAANSLSPITLSISFLHLRDWLLVHFDLIGEEGFLLSGVFFCRRLLCSDVLLMWPRVRILI